MNGRIQKSCIQIMKNKVWKEIFLEGWLDNFYSGFDCSVDFLLQQSAQQQQQQQHISNHLKKGNVVRIIID